MTIEEEQKQADPNTTHSQPPQPQPQDELLLVTPEKPFDENEPQQSGSELIEQDLTAEKVEDPDKVQRKLFEKSIALEKKKMEGDDSARALFGKFEQDIEGDRAVEEVAQKLGTRVDFNLLDAFR